MNTPTVQRVVDQGLRRLDAAGYLEVKPGMVAAWASILGDVPPALLAKAFMHVENTFKPRFYNDRILPPQVREVAMNLVSSDWSEAFEECVLAAERMENPVMTTDPNGNLVCAERFQFSSPLVAQAFHNFGGFPAFKGMQDGDRKQRGPQFREIYKKAAESVQGSSEGILGLAEYKSNVTQISSARQSQLRLQERVKKSRENIRVLPDVHPDLRDGVARKAQALQDFVARGSSQEERDALRRRAQAQWMQTGTVECWEEIEQPVQPKPSRNHLIISQAAKAVGLSVESFKFYARNAQVSIHEFHSPSLGMQEYVLVPDVSKVFAAWESMNVNERKAF